MASSDSSTLKHRRGTGAMAQWIRVLAALEKAGENRWSVPSTDIKQCSSRWPGIPAPGNLAPASAAAKYSLFSWHDRGMGIRCTGALKEIRPQLEQLPGSGRRPDLTVSSLC